jgi:hypothetical protein
LSSSFEDFCHATGTNTHISRTAAAARAGARSERRWIAEAWITTAAAAATKNHPT